MIVLNNIKTAFKNSMTKVLYLAVDQVTNAQPSIQ